MGVLSASWVVLRYKQGYKWGFHNGCATTVNTWSLLHAWPLKTEAPREWLPMMTLRSREVHKVCCLLICGLCTLCVMYAQGVPVAIKTASFRRFLISWPSLLQSYGTYSQKWFRGQLGCCLFKRAARLMKTYSVWSKDLLLGSLVLLYLFFKLIFSNVFVFALVSLGHWEKFHVRPWHCVESRHVVHMIRKFTLMFTLKT